LARNRIMKACGVEDREALRVRLVLW